MLLENERDEGRTKKQEGVQCLLCNRHFDKHVTESVNVIFIRALNDL